MTMRDKKPHRVLKFVDFGMTDIAMVVANVKGNECLLTFLVLHRRQKAKCVSCVIVCPTRTRNRSWHSEDAK